MAVVTIVGLLSSLWFLVQSKADDPDTKPDNQVFLPLIGAGDDNAAAGISNAAITTNQISAQANGVGGRIDGFTFVIPFPADVFDDQLEAGLSNAPPARFVNNFINQPVRTYISIAVNRPNTIIYYDQWEDGYEDDLTVPAQTSTQVWGDGNPANGAPPGIPGDILNADAVIILDNPINLPRNPNQLLFDGGDILTSVNGSIAVSMMAANANASGILYTDAWELYPTQRWGTEYRMPIGENLAGAGANQRGGFDVVGAHVQAILNNTVVDIDWDGNGTTDQTTILNQGGTFSLFGNEGVAPAANSILVGARITASKPVQVQTVATNPVSRYEMRGFTLVPFDQWTNDYLAPRSSDGDIWIYNPHNTALAVTAETVGGVMTPLTVPANSTIKFPAVGLNPVTGVRFTAADIFYGEVALDAGSTQDWGYELLPIANLTTQVLIGMGIGNNNTPPNGNESPVYVTAADDTTVFVDYNNDGTVDASFPFTALTEQAITAPNNNMTGAFLFTQDGVPFVAAWGQDQNAPPALPSIDAGTSITPLPALAIQKNFELVLDQDCNGIISVRDTVRFRLDYFSNAAANINNVTVTDVLSPALGYVPGTTTLNGAPVADGGGSTPFVLDEGGFNAGTLGARTVSSITYQTIVNDTSNPILNKVDIDAPRVAGGTSNAEIVIPTGSASPVMEITTALVDPADGVVSPGQTITVNLIITNTSVSSTVVELPVEYRFNASQLSFAGASTAPDTSGSGVLTWNDLAPLTPGQAVNILLNFTVNQIPAGNSTTFTALINDARRDNSIALLRCQAETSAPLSGPSTPTPTPTQTLTPTPTSTPPTSTPTPTPKPSKGGGSKSTPSPSNPPTPTPVMVAAIPAATPTPGLPVLFLPETGTKESEQKQQVGNVILVLLLITIGVAAVWFWLTTKRAKWLLPSGKDK